MGMGKRYLKRNADEEDAFSRWGRKYLCCLSRAGVISATKRGYRQKERARAHQNLREGKWDA